MPYEKLSRIAGLMSAALVATVTFAVAAHAVQTVTTPNAVIIAYNLAPGANSAVITPAANVPVFVMGNENVPGDVGSSNMTVTNATGEGGVTWNGIESSSGGFTSGASSTAGTHMMFIDQFHNVDIQVNNATSFRVHNTTGTILTAKGDVTLIW